MNWINETETHPANGPVLARSIARLISSTAELRSAASLHRKPLFIASHELVRQVYHAKAVLKSLLSLGVNVMKGKERRDVALLPFSRR